MVWVTAGRHIALVVKDGRGDIKQMTKEDRQEAYRRKRRKQIIDAAERVYLIYGILGLTVRKVVKEAKTTSQTIYTYFGGIEAVIIAMFEHANTGISDAIDAITVMQGDTGVKQSIGTLNPNRAEHRRAICMAIFEHCTSNPIAVELLRHGKNQQKGIPAETEKLINQICARLDTDPDQGRVRLLEVLSVCEAYVERSTRKRKATLPMLHARIARIAE